MIPKTFEGNLSWRKAIRDRANDNEDFQAQMLSACKMSPLFWINCFVWTYRQKMPNAEGDEINLKDYETHWPFITWPVQDEFATLMNECLDLGEDMAVEKSRDMGASWMGLLVLLHRWQFFGNQTFLLMSRKEDYVDDKGNMDSLFEKIRYVLRWQPRWLRPVSVRDNYMHIENRDNGSSFIGESTNINAGQGARKTAAFLDEWARVPNAEEIALALADATACRIYNSTHQGPGTHFHKILNSKPPLARVLRMPWWRHPDKALGAHEVVDPDTNRIKWTSPWYEKEKNRRSKKDIAQNLDMDAGSSGDLFFGGLEMMRHRMAHEKGARNRGHIRVLMEMAETEKKELLNDFDTEKVAFVQDWSKGPWRFWMQLDEETGRPSQAQTYVLAADISNGSGGSNSVLTVACKETGSIVAKFWDAYVSPEVFAEMAMLAGYWFGGLHNPGLLIWENNGPGGIFGRKVVKFKYPHIYMQKLLGYQKDKRTHRHGWHSTKESKEVLLGHYRESLHTGRLINPCKEGLDEACDYIYNDLGVLMPASLREESGGGQELHGDHVIADALADMALTELPKAREYQRVAPAGSFEYRRRQIKSATEKQKDEAWR